MSETVGIYAVGFLDAAVTLFGKADEGRGLVDLTFYPAAYCMRHGLELLAKQMSIYFAYELRDPTLLYTRGHAFEDLWKRQAECLESVANGLIGNPAELRHHIDVLNTAVEELHELDPTGTLLRYPEEITKVKPTGERKRIDQHVPFDRVNLGDWHATAGAALSAAQTLLYEVGQRIEFFRGERGDPPLPISDLVRHMEEETPPE